MYISIDIGGTNIRIAKSKDLKLDSLDYSIIYKSKLTHDYQIDIQNIIDILSKVGKINAISIGLAGRVNLPEWKNRHFRAKLSKRFKCPVFVHSDAVIGALGFKYFSKINVPNKFLYITWGTGIGGVIIEAKSNKSHITKVDYEKYRRKFEMQYGGKNLHAKYGKDLSALEKSEWNSIFDGFSKELLKLAKSFEPIPLALGGGATAKHTAELQNISKDLLKQNVILHVSTLGDDIGVMGGFACLFENLVD